MTVDVFLRVLLFGGDMSELLMVRQCGPGMVQTAIPDSRGQVFESHMHFSSG